jgi:secretion/DNA translocation related CpaE-like protein
MEFPAVRPFDAGAARPLIITADSELLDDILRLAAAAGVAVDVVPDPTAARPTWGSAPIVLVGDDVADAVGRARLRRRRDVVVVGRDLDDAGIWRRAVTAGAEHVALLPDAEPWLVGRLGDVSDGSARGAKVVTVIGGRGGAGASTLAAALAVTGMRQRRSTILIDADPLGGGADLLFGGENAAGLRWPDLVSTQGRIAAHALREALPAVGGLAVLSWDRGDMVDLAPGAMASVVEASSRACELVVVDMPRRFDEACEIALAASDVALLLVPAEVRAAAAAARVAALVAQFADDVRLVVRGPAPGGLEPADLADALQLPLDGHLKPEPDLAVALERGEVPAGRGAGPLAQYCADLLLRLDVDRPPSQLSDTAGWRSL